MVLPPALSLSTLLGVLLCPLPRASRLSVLLCSMLGNFKQPKNRTVISKSVWCVSDDALYFSVPSRASFHDGPLFTKRTAPEGKISKDERQLQSESAATAASSFFFSSFSLVCISNLFLGYYGFPCIVKESVSVLALLRIRWTVVPAAVNTHRGVLGIGRRPPSVGIKRFRIRPQCVSCLLYGLLSTLCFVFLIESVAKPHTERGGAASRNSRFDLQVTKIELAPLHVCRCLSYRVIKKKKKRANKLIYRTRPPFFVSFVPPLNFFCQLST